MPKRRIWCHCLPCLSWWCWTVWGDTGHWGWSELYITILLVIIWFPSPLYSMPILKWCLKGKYREIVFHAFMYPYHYEFIMPKYPGAKLLFTDMDSLCYHIPSKTDIYADFQGNQDWFDFCNYDLDHPNLILMSNIWFLVRWRMRRMGFPSLNLLDWEQRCTPSRHLL